MFTFCAYNAGEAHAEGHEETSVEGKFIPFSVTVLHDIFLLPHFTRTTC